MNFTASLKAKQVVRGDLPKGRDMLYYTNVTIHVSPLEDLASIPVPKTTQNVAFPITLNYVHNGD